MSGAGPIAAVAFWLSAALLVYVYWGYGALLGLLVAVRRTSSPVRSGFVDAAWPSVAVLLTVHNEERQIERRLENLLAQDYPPGRLDIVVASDGSIDRTEAIVEAYGRSGPVRLVRSPRLGKSAAQNEAMRSIDADIVVLTDAEARFDPGCVRALAAAFADPATGCATAELHHIDSAGAIGRSQGLYWTYELKLRALESRLGILGVASGAAMAFRRELFRDLPTFAGDDCIIPLEVVRRGQFTVHCPKALAWDRAHDEQAAELRARIRMTMRNWTGTWLFPELLDPRRHVGYAFALWSHKLLRWLCPIALLAMTSAAAIMAFDGTGRLAAVAFALALILGVVGWGAAAAGRSLPVAGQIYSFLLANLGFLIGIGRALRGERLAAYRTAAR